MAEIPHEVSHQYFFYGKKNQESKQSLFQT